MATVRPHEFRAPISRTSGKMDTRIMGAATQKVAGTDELCTFPLAKVDRWTKPLLNLHLTWMHESR